MSFTGEGGAGQDPTKVAVETGLLLTPGETVIKFGRTLKPPPKRKEAPVCCTTSTLCVPSAALGLMFMVKVTKFWGSGTAERIVTPFPKSDEVKFPLVQFTFPPATVTTKFCCPCKPQLGVTFPLDAGKNVAGQVVAPTGGFVDPDDPVPG